MSIVLERPDSDDSGGAWRVAEGEDGGSEGGMFLDAEELRELTGYKVAAYQARWLERRGYPFELSVMDKPRVLRAYVERRFGIVEGDGGKGVKDPNRQEPDFSYWTKRHESKNPVDAEDNR
jgi:hypothetical protein